MRTCHDVHAVIWLCCVIYQLLNSSFILVNRKDHTALLWLILNCFFGLSPYPTGKQVVTQSGYYICREKNEDCPFYYDYYTY